MVNAKNANTIDAIVYTPFIPLQSVPILWNDNESQYKFKIDVHVLDFKITERSLGEWKK